MRRHGDTFKVSGYLRREPYLAELKHENMGNRARAIPGDSNLARARVAAGLALSELAELAGISASTLRRLERRELRRPMPYLVKLAYVLRIPLGVVLDD